MVSARRASVDYALVVGLLLSGVVVWLGDVNWWDEPWLPYVVAEPARVVHSLAGYGLGMLFATLYWHSKVRWADAGMRYRVSGMWLWGSLLALLLTGGWLLYGEQDSHVMAVVAHAGGALMLLISGWVHGVRRR